MKKCAPRVRKMSVVSKSRSTFDEGIIENMGEESGERGGEKSQALRKGTRRICYGPSNGQT
jgi:hypothetical protein